MKRFKEFEEIGDNDIVVIIEHWYFPTHGSNKCDTHQSNTRHIEEKYLLYAKTLRQAVLLKYPMVRVYCKPVAITKEDFMQQIGINRDPSVKTSCFVEDYRPQMRLGAFEVQVCRKVRGEVVAELLHSKLQSRYWPNISVVLQKIGTSSSKVLGRYVKHTRIQVKVYSTTSEEKLKDVKVSLTCNTERLDEMLKFFNESLLRLEERHKSRGHFLREHGRRLNRSFVQRQSQTLDEEQRAEARPISAVSNRSLNSIAGL